MQTEVAQIDVAAKTGSLDNIDNIDNIDSVVGGKGGTCKNLSRRNS